MQRVIMSDDVLGSKIHGYPFGGRFSYIFWKHRLSLIPIPEASSPLRMASIYLITRSVPINVMCGLSRMFYVGHFAADQFSPHADDISAHPSPEALILGSFFLPCPTLTHTFSESISLPC